MKIVSYIEGESSASDVIIQKWELKRKESGAIALYCNGVPFLFVGMDGQVHAYNQRVSNFKDRGLSYEAQGLVDCGYLKIQ